MVKNNAIIIILSITKRSKRLHNSTFFFLLFFMSCLRSLFPSIFTIINWTVIQVIETFVAFLYTMTATVLHIVVCDDIRMLTDPVLPCALFVFITFWTSTDIVREMLLTVTVFSFALFIFSGSINRSTPTKTTL